MKKILYIAIIAGVLVNSYWVHRLYKYTKKLDIYFTYNELQASCTEAAAREHDDQIVRLSNHQLKPFGNILHVYLGYIPECKKWAEYKCWMAESDEEHEQCYKRREAEEEFFKQ